MFLFTFALLLWFIVINGVHGLSSIFGDVNDKYLHGILRNTKSSEMINYLNVSCDPCTNFYDFACGNYKRINPSNDFLKNDIFQDLTDGMHRKFLSLIKHDDATDTLTDMKVKNFYESCMNLAILRTTYRFKLREIINEFGHMPALEGDDWRDSNYFEWLETIAKINHKYGKIIIFGCKVFADLNNKKVNSLYLVPQDMPLGSKSVYTRESKENARNIRKMNIAYNLEYIFGLRTSEAEKTAEEIFQFETHLFVGYEGRRSTNYKSLNYNSSAAFHFLTIHEMQSKYGEHIDIQRLINITFGYLPNKHVIDMIESSAENIINVVNLTSPRIVANYIFYNLIENFMLVRDPAARDMENFMVLATPKRKHQLQKVCIVETENHFARMLNNMVYRKYMSNETELNLKPMWEIMKLAFRGILDSNKLPGMAEIHTKAVEKLQTIKLNLNVYENVNFNEKYDDLTISKHDFVENVKAIFILKALKARASLNQSSFTTLNEDDVLFLSPVYNPFENSIKVPVSLLQPYYLWSNYYPKALKYGTVGFLIAREMIRAFDQGFINFDKSGNLAALHELDSVQYFSNVRRCFSHQYHTYYMNGLSLPKLDSEDENILDTGGIRLAYNAYRWWYTQNQQQNSSDERLPNLNYSNQQLFFISFGQMFCSVGNDLTKSANSFAVDSYRVNQALSNLDDFSKVFKCSEHSKMNPRTKCMIY